MDKLYKYIDSKRKELIDFTKRLVEIPTVNPPGLNYEKAVAAIEAQCRRFGLSTRRIETPRSLLKKRGVREGSRRITLVAEWNLRRRGTVHLNGHYDVVPPTGGWNRGPFKAVIKQGRMYGRGTEDMKATLAAMLYAAGAVKACGLKPRVNVELSFVPDEETGGETGAGYSMRKRLKRPDFVIGEGYSRGFISNGNKGVLWARVEVRGRSAHASEPYKGINAFEKMIAVTEELMRLKARVQKRSTRCFVRDKGDRRATFVMGGKVQGRDKVNIIPDKFSFSIDRRILPEEDMENVKAEIRDAIEKVKKKDKELDVKVSFDVAEGPVIAKADSPLCNAMCDAVKSVHGKRAEAAVLPGCTDIRFLARRGSQAAGYSVAGEERHHGDNEFIYIKSLIDTTKVFATAIMNLR